METYKKLSEYDIRTVLSMSDLFPTLVDNGDGTYTNKNVPLSAIRTYSAVPAGGSTNQVLQKTNGTDYITQWHTLVKSDVGLGNVDNTSDVNKPVSTATTSAISTAMSALYPVGSIYINASVSTNPGTLLGFGTWSAFGTGRVIVGVDTSQTEFNTLGQTGGEKTHVLTVAEMPSHNHTLRRGNYGNLRVEEIAYSDGGAPQTNSAGVGNTGGDGAHNNLQPYITVYMWKRTA